MFAKSAVQLLSLLFLARGIFASPLSNKRGSVFSGAAGSISARGNPTPLDNWGGISSMSNFDSFNGPSNFDGSQNKQTIIVQENQVVCHQQTVEIIQQRLVVLQEMAKKIVTEQICDVETQTIVFTQFHSSLGNFRNDLQRKGGRQPGFDDNIAGRVQQLVGSDGSLSTNDLGFKGTDVGNNTIAPGGSNWNNSTSPASVQSALEAADAAKNSTSASN